jgi:hypothetical protein
MIRVESKLGHDLSVPLRPEMGNKSPVLVIPMATPQGPGVVETDKLDSVTIARLTYHYGRRARDGKNENTAEVDSDGRPRFLEIGLLKFTDTDGNPLGQKPEPDAKAPTVRSSAAIEPPKKKPGRRAA